MNKPPVNLFELPAALTARLAGTSHQAGKVGALPVAHRSALTFDDLLTPFELAGLLDVLNTQPWVAVGSNGIREDYRDGDPVGSWRLSTRSDLLAGLLWQRISRTLPTVRYMDGRDDTDWDEHPAWRPVAVNPLLRFIRYERDGLLVPHYDAPYDPGDGRRRTLSTVIVYLEQTPGLQGGQTRFIADAQHTRPLHERNFSDWTRAADPEEIRAVVEPLPGRGLLFDHRVLHDSAPLTGRGRKTLLRTDILYERA